MSGPGEYRAVRIEGITRVEDLPQAKLVERNRNSSRSRRPCPECGRSCYRNRTIERTLHDLGDLDLLSMIVIGREKDTAGGAEL